MKISNIIILGHEIILGHADYGSMNSKSKNIINIYHFQQRNKEIMYNEKTKQIN